LHNRFVELRDASAARRDGSTSNRPDDRTEAMAMRMDTRSMWDPWQEMRRLQSSMEHLATDMTPGWRWPLTGQYPPVNITRTDTAITVEALCPGVDRESLDLGVVGDAVTIRGERKPEPDVPEERYYRRERPLGAFTRSLSVGDLIDAEKTKAHYANGILRIELARVPEATPKKIPIQG
jgi:HSP20 family protein